MSSSTSSERLQRPGVIREVWPKAHNITSLIGQTPLIELPQLVGGTNRLRLYVKQEGTNPGGSIRDRTVLEILDNAAASGLLYRGDEIVIAGASNSAVSAAMIGNARGYPVVVRIILEGRIRAPLGPAGALNPAMLKRESKVPLELKQNKRERL